MKCGSRVGSLGEALAPHPLLRNSLWNHDISKEAAINMVVVMVKSVKLEI